jgi:hypothetical protein
MSPRLCRVRRLELTASDDALVRRASILLEDALRTASLVGADDDRVVLVRQLDLGIIRCGSPAGIALEAERRFANLAMGAIHATEPAGATAPVVFFRDDAEPCIALAQRVARGEPALEWFWPLAVPGWNVALARDTGLRFLLFRALETSAGVAAAVRLVQALAAAGAVDHLLAALRPEDGRAFALACGWSEPASALRGEEEAAPLLPAPWPPGLPLDRASLELLGQWSETWGAHDARTTWLACILVAGSRPAWLGSAYLVIHAAQALRAAACVRAAPPVEPGSEEESRGWARAAGRAVPRRDGPTRNKDDPRPTSPQARRPRHRSEAGRVERETPGRTPDLLHDHGDAGGMSGTTEPLAEAPRRTRSAGLFFLVSLLSRLGIDTELREQAELVEGEFALKLIHRTAALLGISREDPAVVCLPPLSTALEFEGTDRALAATWSRSMRGSCATGAAMTLRALVGRPGLVTATPTHIDVFFDHRQAEVGIRRAGLDVDPGWVPWFGRVLHFHYQYGELFRAE